MGYDIYDAQSWLKGNRERNKTIQLMMGKEFIDKNNKRRIFTADDAKKFRYMIDYIANTEMHQGSKRLEELKRREAEKAVEDLMKPWISD